MPDHPPSQRRAPAKNAPFGQKGLVAWGTRHREYGDRLPVAIEAQLADPGDPPPMPRSEMVRRECHHWTGAPPPPAPTGGPVDEAFDEPTRRRVMTPTSDDDLDPRWLAVDALHTAIRRKLDVLGPARRVVSLVDAEWQTNFGDGAAVWLYVSDWDAIGAALLSGDGKRWAEREWNILDAYDGTMKHRLGRLRDLPKSQYSRAEWLDAAWLRILAGDWRPINAKPIAINDFELTLPLLNAASARDRTAIEKAVRAFERRDHGRPSILGFALRRVLLAPEPPPVPSSPSPSEPPHPAPRATVPSGKLARGTDDSARIALAGRIGPMGGVLQRRLVGG